MYKPRNVGEWGVVAAVIVLFVTAAAWIGYGGSERHAAKDYEDCAGNAQTDASSTVEYNKLVTRCSERFAGRRKAGGGYAYFDFMQNKTFDIAGPNPTDDERKRIDRSYMEFLGTQAREMFLAELAKAQANQEQVDLRRGRQGAGPLELTPKIPLPVKRPVIERSKSCNDGSLSCSWAKLTATVKNAFASSKNE
jgi:hypothetical protein